MASAFAALRAGSYSLLIIELQMGAVAPEHHGVSDQRALSISC